MKKICTLFVAFLCFIQISSAGTLTFGLPFVESFAKTLRIKNSECPKTLLNDKNIDYWCNLSKLKKSLLLYGGEQNQKRSTGKEVLNWREMIKLDI